MKIQELKDIVKKIEEHKSQIAKHRDELREIYDNLVDCLEAFDCGVDDLDEGISIICNAIDNISEVV